MLKPWLDAVKEIAPREVMIYTIDRETPDHSLQKATHEELDAIRDRVVALGIPCTASILRLSNRQIKTCLGSIFTNK